MKIIKLKAENVKRLQAIEISPDGASMVIVGGRNGQGKTSTLDSIEMALHGGKSIPAKPIRDGALKAQVIVETDEYTVTRKFTQKGSQLEITAKDGSKVGSPQTLLDTLIGKLSFDPLEFSRMKPAEQAATLKAVVGLDLSKLDQERARKFDERTDINRELKSVQAQAESIPPKPVPDRPVDAESISAELKAINDAKAANDAKRRALQVNAANRDVLLVRIEKLKAELEGLQRQALDYAQVIEQQEAEVAALIDPDEGAIAEKLKGAEAINTEIRRQQQRRELEARALVLKKNADDLTARMAAIDEERAEKLAAAQFPIAGLAFGESGVTFNGLPFDQCCDSEKLKVSVAMGLALNPQLKVLLIRDGSLLDADSLKLVAEMAETADAQCWIERVSEGAECQIIIEDGMVSEDRMEHAK